MTPRSVSTSRSRWRSGTACPRISPRRRWRSWMRTRRLGWLSRGRTVRASARFGRR
ncbi:hypothetical protein ACFPRL_03650 [Pseudoclavibacter helvolus]